MTDAVEKGLRTSPNSDSADSRGHLVGGGDDGAAEQRSGERLFYAFRLDDRVPKDHLLRRIDVFVTAALGVFARTGKKELQSEAASLRA